MFPLGNGVVQVEPDLSNPAPAVITVPKAERWKQGKDDAKPEKGNAYVSVLIRIEAEADSDYSPYYATLRNAQGFNYDWLVFPRREPWLASGELAPGQSVQGWVTFEVPAKDLDGLTLVYDSLFGEQVVIPLDVAT